jgi:CubicO group peptidase (beta-lactamase class C family)
MNKHYKEIVSLFLALGIALATFAQDPTSKEVDDLVQKTMTAFNVPGIAVGIIKDGKVIHSKGYGIRSINTKKPVDSNTSFAIASNSKAFTAFALGMLVDEGKLTWDSKVVDFIPEFRMYDPYVTSEFTVRDLLTHRSGLGLGAGDLMFWPDSANFSTEEVIHNLRYLKPVSSFRTKFDYDNLLYIVAGEVLKRASGMSWEEFIEQKNHECFGHDQLCCIIEQVEIQGEYH